MGAYRLYFLDEANHVVAADVFDASRDHEATQIAVMLADACSDACAGFELWQADRRVVTQVRLSGAAVSLARAHASTAVEDAVIAREERIRESRSRVAESRRLLVRLDELRNVKKFRTPASGE